MKTFYAHCLETILESTLKGIGFWSGGVLLYALAKCVARIVG